MITDGTIARLCGHSGLHDRASDGEPTIASCTWSGDSWSPAIPRAVADFVATLSALNHEVNGDVPSETGSTRDALLPRTVVFAVAEATRMLRELRPPSEEARVELSRLVWRVETAWLAVLHGDIDSIEAHVREEELARFG